MSKILSPEAQQNKEDFKLFMRLLGLSDKTIRNYLNGLHYCSNYIQIELNRKGFSDLYDVTDQTLIRYFQEILYKKSSFISDNEKGHNTNSCSLSNYIKFVDFLFIFKR